MGWLLSCLWDGYYPVCGMVTILSVGWLLSCMWDGYYPVCGMVTILSVGWLLSCLWDGYYPVCGMVTILSVGWLLSCLWDGASEICTSGRFTTEPYLAPSLTKTKFKWEAAVLSVKQNLVRQGHLYRYRMKRRLDGRVRWRI